MIPLCSCHDLYRYFIRYKKKMESFYERLRIRIVKWTPNKKAYNKGCWEWDGPRKSGSSYGTCNLYIPGGDQMRVNAHRASYIAHNQRFVLPYDISHLCHECKCVNPNHLSHETHAINMEREICCKAGGCTEHYHDDGSKLKSCIFAVEE